VPAGRRGSVERREAQQPSGALRRGGERSLICRLVTLKYDRELSGFPEDALRAAQSSGVLLEVREHWFDQGGVPHIALLLLLDEGRGGSGKSRLFAAEDPGNELPDALKPLYRVLRQWRNDRAKEEGVPAYTLFRNAQLAEICRRSPRSLAALREIEGVGEATCRKYGADLLALFPEEEASPKEQGRP